MFKRASLLVFCATTGLMWGQGAPPPTPGLPGGDPPMARGLMRPRLGGKWWDNPEVAKRVGITAEQQKKMDEVFQQSRLKLIDLTASLQKEEVVMDGLMQNPQLDDAKILPVADRIAEARAELEKTNVRMLLGIRHVLTPEQWAKVEAEHPDRPPRPARPGRDNDGPRPPAAPRPFEE